MSRGCGLTAARCGRRDHPTRSSRPGEKNRCSSRAAISRLNRGYAVRCAAAGRHRHSRPSEVHARYISGQSPGGDISRGAEVLVECIYSNPAVFPAPTSAAGAKSPYKGSFWHPTSFVPEDPVDHGSTILVRSAINMRQLRLPTTFCRHRLVERPYHRIGVEGRTVATDVVETYVRVTATIRRDAVDSAIMSVDDGDTLSADEI